MTLGKTVHFSCEAHGNPTPNITWYHNAVRIHPSARRSHSGNKLRIGGVTREDSGLYQCLVNNNVGFAQSVGSLNFEAGKMNKTRTQLNFAFCSVVNTNVSPFLLVVLQLDHSLLTGYALDQWFPNVGQSNSHQPQSA